MSIQNYLNGSDTERNLLVGCKLATEVLMYYQLQAVDATTLTKKSLLNKYISKKKIDINATAGGGLAPTELESFSATFRRLVGSHTAGTITGED